MLYDTSELKATNMLYQVDSNIHTFEGKIVQVLNDLTKKDT